MDFIWRLRGSVALDRTGPNEVALERVERLLEGQRKGVSERGADYLAFDDPFWSAPFGPNWLAMVIYDRGRFWIEQGLGGRRLHYDLRSLHGLVFCLFGALMFFLFGLAFGSLSSGLKLSSGAFAWIYGGNIALAVARVPLAIRNAVRSA